MAQRSSGRRSKNRANRNSRPTRLSRNIREPRSLAAFPTYRIRRTIDSGIVPIAVADQGFAYYITPGSFSNWTDFSNLYDMYRVSKITYRYVCWRTAQPATTGEAFPTHFLALDLNDTVAPASAPEILDYGNSEIHQYAEGDKRVFEVSYVPKLQFQTAAATAVLSDAGWARTSSTTDTWLGHKSWLRNYNTTTYNNTVVALYITVDLEFKVSK